MPDKQKDPCIFFNEVIGRCSALSIISCPDNCSFRKTEAQYNEQKDRCIMRCRNLKLCRKGMKCRYGFICNTSSESKEQGNETLRVIHKG